jgi:hypothetical protein
VSKVVSEVVVRIGISGGGEFTVLSLTWLTLSRKEFNNSSGVPAWQSGVAGWRTEFRIFHVFLLP